MIPATCCSVKYNLHLSGRKSSLNPEDFIRANKRFILSRDRVKNIYIWFDSRLLVTLDIETPERIYFSKNKAAEFKAGMVSS